MKSKPYNIALKERIGVVLAAMREIKYYLINLNNMKIKWDRISNNIKQTQ